MSHFAEDAISESVRALVQRRPSLAQQVIEKDNEIDALEVEIDGLCYDVISLEQPVARDLRLVATILKIVRDIERIGDAAVNVAERAVELIEEPELKPLIDVAAMGRAALKMLEDGIDAFVNSDAALAEKVVERDGFLDNVYDQILCELRTYMTEDQETVSRSLRLIFVAKNLERVGDHCKNIAEMVVFLVHGDDIRHSRLSTNPIHPINNGMSRPVNT